MTRRRRASDRASRAAAASSTDRQAGSTPGMTAANAAARCAARLRSDPSTLSARYQATGASARPAHAARRVVFPEPAGATTRVRRCCQSRGTSWSRRSRASQRSARRAHFGGYDPRRGAPRGRPARPALVCRPRPHLALRTPSAGRGAQLPRRARHSGPSGRGGSSRLSTRRSGLRAASARVRSKAAQALQQGRGVGVSGRSASSRSRSGRCETITNSRSKAVRSGADPMITTGARSPSSWRTRRKNGGAAVAAAPPRHAGDLVASVRPGSGDDGLGGGEEDDSPSEASMGHRGRGRRHGAGARRPLAGTRHVLGAGSGRRGRGGRSAVHQDTSTSPWWGSGSPALDGRSDRFTPPKVTGTGRDALPSGGHERPPSPAGLLGPLAAFP